MTRRVGVLALFLPVLVIAFGFRSPDRTAPGAHATPPKTGASDTSLTEVRRAELARRAVRPAVELSDDPHEPAIPLHASWDDVLSFPEEPLPEELDALRHTQPMPATDCQSVVGVSESQATETAALKNAMTLHAHSVSEFENRSGFGFLRGVFSESSDVRRIELVSLLTEHSVTAYVAEESVTPPQALIAKRRPLDRFEELALEALRAGADLVTTADAPTRMVGSIRADTRCIDCHSQANVGDLLGAMTYYLNVAAGDVTAR